LIDIWHDNNGSRGLLTQESVWTMLPGTLTIWYKLFPGIQVPRGECELIRSVEPVSTDLEDMKEHWPSASQVPRIWNKV